MSSNRRRFFLINKPLQLRFMLYVTLPLLVITSLIMAGLYIGIWGSMLDAFSDEQLRNDLLTASRLTEYEQARVTSEAGSSESLVFLLKAEKLSQRQKEVFKEILDYSNKRVIPKFILLLILIGWGTVYISHRIAGPLYRLEMTLKDMRAGNFKARFHLRKSDEGKFMIQACNETLVSLDETFSRLKTIIRENEPEPRKMTALLKEELSKIKTSADS